MHEPVLNNLSDSHISDNTSQCQERVMTALNSLKVQHAALLKSMPAHPISDLSRFMQASLPITTEEEEQSDQHERSGGPYLTSPKSKRSRHSSISTIVTDSVQWFDALDVAEEFVMDVPVTPAGNGSPSHFVPDTRSAISNQEDSSADTDTEEHDKSSLLSGKGPRAGIKPSDETPAVVRRTKLPASPTGDEGSLFTILKKNIGKVCVFYICFYTYSIISIRTWLRSRFLSLSMSH